MTTVNINIKNCNCSGSGSGSGSGGGSGLDDTINTTPTTQTDPPNGYSASGITGRSCKVAVWMYMWAEAWLQVFSDNSWVVSTILSQVIAAAGSRLLARPIATLLGGFLGAVFGLIATPGATPDDLVWTVIGGGIAWVMIELSANYAADQLTQTMIEDALPAFQSKRAEFICQIAKAQNANEAASNVKRWLASNFPEPVQWILYSLLSAFFNLVFFTADWWPGFDEHIEGIEEVCCEGFTDGNLIEPGSAQACRGANFVLDGLVGCLTAADMYVQNYSRTSYNSLSGTEAAMLANVQANYFVPESIVNKAWSWQLSQAELARYMYAKLSGTSWLVPGTGVNTWEMGRLGAHLQTEIAICELRDCETAQAAYELLAGAIDAWLSANVTDQDLSNHIRLFCQGLIHPSGAFIGLLFTESADLAGFAGSSDCEECVPESVLGIAYGVVITYGTKYAIISSVAQPTLPNINFIEGNFSTPVTITESIVSGNMGETKSFWVNTSPPGNYESQSYPWVNRSDVTYFSAQNNGDTGGTSFSIRVDWV